MNNVYDCNVFKLLVVDGKIIVLTKVQTLRLVSIDNNKNQLKKIENSAKNGDINSFSDLFELFYSEKDNKRLVDISSTDINYSKYLYL